MSTSPTPSEREASDKAAKLREQEEQNALPYKWTQTIQDLDLSSPVPANFKGKDLDVKITSTTLKAGIKGQAPIVEARASPTKPSPRHGRYTRDSC